MRVLTTTAFASIVAFLTIPGVADAQSVLRWQLQPYCNAITLTIVQQGATFQLSGADDLCGAGVAPVTGTAVPVGGEAILGLTIALPSGRATQVWARVSLASGSGTWSDADGNTGAFALVAASTGGPPRPAPASAAVILPNQLSPTIFGGTGAATTVARSDHTHDDRYYTKPQVDARRTVQQTLSRNAMRWTGGETTFTTNGCVTRPANGETYATLPFDLPVGATLHQVVVYVLDSTIVNEQFTILLRRNHISGIILATETVRSVTGGDTSLSMDTVDLSPATPRVVAAADSYYLEFRVPTAGSFSSGYCGGTVTYTLPPL